MWIQSQVMMCSIINVVIYLAMCKLNVGTAVIKKQLAPDKATLNSLYSPFTLFLNCLILIIHPSPFQVKIKIWIYHEYLHNYYFYYQNDFSTLVVMTKSQIILRFALETTLYGGDQGHRVANMFGFKNHTMYILRCLMKDYSIYLVVLQLIQGIIFFGIMLMIAESPLDRIHNRLG